jgi:hypothetical protein
MSTIKIGIEKENWMDGIFELIWHMGGERRRPKKKAFGRIFWGEARRIRAMGVYLHCLCVRMLIGS